MKKFTKLCLISALSVATITALGACKKNENKPSAPDTYTVNFIVNGVSVHSIEVKKNSNCESGYSVTDVDGYDFSGWFTDDTCTTSATFPVKVEADTNFYGEWLEETYTLTHKDGETVLSTDDYFKAAYLVAPEAPEKEGFRFNGWYTDEECTKLFDYIEDQMPAHDLTLYAGWTTLYAVSYDLDGGVGSAKDYYAKDEVILEPEAPQKDGYVFLGWYTDEECTTAYNFNEFMTEEGVTLYAGWRNKNSNVTVYFKNGNEVVATIDGQMEGDPVPEYNGTELSKDKFVFDGWFIDENCTYPVSKYALTNEDLIVYAGWHLNEKYATVRLLISGAEQEVYVEKGTSFAQALTGVSIQIPADTVVESYLENGEAFDEDTVVYGNKTLTVNYYTQGLSFVKTNDGCEVNAYTGTAVTVYVPNLYQGEPIVSIAQNAFKETQLTSLNFEEGSQLKYVAYNAFAGTPFESAMAENEFTCLAGRVLFKSTTTKQDVTLDSAIVSIATGAFEGLSVKTVVASGVVVLGDYAFSGCSQLTSFKGANRIESIGVYAFKDCTSLTEVSLNGLNVLSQGTFFGCTSLTKISLPAALKTIGDGAFKNCTSLQRVDVGTSIQGSSLTEIGDYAFENCTSLTIIVAYGQTPFTASESAIYSGTTIYVKTNYVEAYKTALPALASRIDSVENIPVEG